MADVTLSVKQTNTAGLDFAANKTTVVTANNYFIPNDGLTRLWVENGTGNTCAVSVVTPGTDADGNAIADKSPTTIATGKHVVIGPFKVGVYNDASGLVKVTFDQTVDIVAFH